MFDTVERHWVAYSGWVNNLINKLVSYALSRALTLLFMPPLTWVGGEGSRRR